MRKCQFDGLWLAHSSACAPARCHRPLQPRPRATREVAHPAGSAGPTRAAFLGLELSAIHQMIATRALDATSISPSWPTSIGAIEAVERLQLLVRASGRSLVARAETGLSAVARARPTKSLLSAGRTMTTAGRRAPEVDPAPPRPRAVSARPPAARTS